jgi:hypothetical protein
MSSKKYETEENESSLFSSFASVSKLKIWVINMSIDIFLGADNKGDMSVHCDFCDSWENQGVID